MLRYFVGQPWTLMSAYRTSAQWIDHGFRRSSVVHPWRLADLLIPADECSNQGQRNETQSFNTMTSTSRTVVLHCPATSRSRHEFPTSTNDQSQRWRQQRDISLRCESKIVSDSKGASTSRGDTPWSVGPYSVHNHPH